MPQTVSFAMRNIDDACKVVLDGGRLMRAYSVFYVISTHNANSILWQVSLSETQMRPQRESYNM